MASIVSKISFSDIRRYAEQNFGDEFHSLPSPLTVQVEEVTKLIFPRGLKIFALRTWIRRRVLVGHITIPIEPGTSTSKEVFAYLYNWKAGNSAPGIFFDVDRMPVRVEDIASINFIAPFRYLGAPDSSRFSTSDLWALSTYYCMARDYTFHPISLIHRELFLNHFKEACRLVHKDVNMSDPEHPPAQSQKKLSMAVLRLNPSVLRSFQCHGPREATRVASMSTIKPPTPSPAISVQVEAASTKRPLSESNVSDRPEPCGANPITKKPRIDLSTTSPPLPDDLDDETLKSIQQRLHRGRAAQVEAEEAKKNAATLLVERNALQSEIKSFEAENTTLKTEMAALKQALDLQRAESTAARLDKNAKLTAEIIDLKTSLKKERDNAKTETETAKKKVNALRTQNNDLMSEKNSLSEQVTMLTTEKRELDNRVSTLTTESDALGTENDGLKGQVDKLEREVKSAIGNLEVYKMRVRAIANEP